MEDKEFFDRALQLEAPWFVCSVKLDLQEKKVELEIGVEKGWRWKDGEGRAVQVHGREEREWRHLGTMQCETTIRARVPRLKRTDGSTEVAAVPWAERYTRWTLAFEDYAVQVIEACSSLSVAADLLELDWSSLRRIVERAVEGGCRVVIGPCAWVCFGRSRRYHRAPRCAGDLCKPDTGWFARNARATRRDWIVSGNS